MVPQPTSPFRGRPARRGSDTFSLSGNGQNFFAVTSNGGDIIESVKIVMTGGNVDDVKQFQLDGVSSIAAVPERSTWAMMILGSVGVGAMTYRRRKTSALAA
jgi:hypothetical protein